VFIRKSSTGFCIILVYIDELNIIDYAKDKDEAHNHLKKEFKLKDLGKTKFCLGLQIEHLQMGILVHHSAYVKKVLEKFNMDKAYLQRTPMIVHTLEKDTDPFRPKKREKRFCELNTHTSVSLAFLCTEKLSGQFLGLIVMSH
jgi:hypothetical protein